MKFADHCDKIIFILSGKVDIFIPVEGELVYVESLYRGSAIGVWSALDSKNFLITGVAAKPTAVAYLGKNDLFNLGLRYPQEFQQMKEET